MDRNETRLERNLRMLSEAKERAATDSDFERARSHQVAMDQLQELHARAEERAA